MASSFLTVKENPAQISKLFNEDTEAKDDEISTKLSCIQGDMQSLEITERTESKGSVQNSLNMSRKIFMSTQHQLQNEKLLRLGSLYCADQRLADQLSAVFNRDDTSPSYLKALQKSALREMFMESTDDFTVSLGLVAKPGIRLLGGLATLDREGDQLLQEFFNLCREPNLAEIEMLAEACRAPTEIVSSWFALKREQTQNLFVMQGLVTKDSRLGTKLRKREYLLREGPILWPSLPSEFEDPDLNECWLELGETWGKSII